MVDQKEHKIQSEIRYKKKCRIETVILVLIILILVFGGYGIITNLHRLLGIF